MSSSPIKTAVVIVGGSFSGLSAGLCLGRSLRECIILDTNKRCNWMVDHARNFLTHDGESPSKIAETAREQLKRYKTVQLWQNEGATSVKKMDSGRFLVTTSQNRTIEARKLIIASGVKDIMPEDIEGFAEQWGRTILHCPYCHGYEVRARRTGILANGSMVHHLVCLLLNWTKELTVFTNGPSTIPEEHLEDIKRAGVKIIEKPVKKVQMQPANGDESPSQLWTHEDGTTAEVDVMYHHPKFEQSVPFADQLGYELKDNLITIDFMQKTTVAGVYACGDATSRFRTLATSTSTGMCSGAFVNMELCQEDFSGPVKDDDRALLEESSTAGSGEAA